MKNLLESWDRFLNEENNAEKLDKSNEVREFINSLLSDEVTFSEIKSAIFDKFIDYPDVKDVVVYEAGRSYQGSRPSVVITFEKGKGLPPYDEPLSVDFDFEEPADEDLLNEKKKKKQQKGKKRARTVAKRAGKKKKDDRCTRIAKRKYDVWPSAYASGAVVQCRRGKIWKGVKEDIEASELIENTEYEDLLEEEVLAFQDELLAEIEIIDEKKKKKQQKGKKRARKVAKRKKAGSESSKEKSLSDWFGRKGAKGKSGGWVDCNTCRKDKSGRTRCKSCGRQKGEKRSKYPACRPTPGACKEKGRGKSWGKKSKKKNEALEQRIEKMVIKELQEQLFKPGLKHHVENNIPLTENIYRIGSPCYFNVIKQGREYYKMGLYETTNPDEIDLFENTDLGEWAMFEGEEVPLDFPMYEETLEEAKKKKKDPPIGKPTKNTGGGKKYKVYVRNPKTGNVKKITYGDSKGGLKGNWNNAEARASFAARHKCAEKKDRTSPGYWACRAHKDFGKNVPGRFW